MSTRSAIIGAILVVLLASLAWASSPRDQAVIPASGATLELTPAEKEWLAQHPVVRVGGPLAFPPFHYYDDQGRPRGIATQYAQKLLERLGLTVDYQGPQPWPQVLEKASQGELDLIAAAAKASDREAYLAYSQAYLSFPLVIITARDAPFVSGLADLTGKRIALVEKVSTQRWLEEAGLNFDPVPVKSPLGALEAVALGRADACIENLAAASYLMQKHALNNLKIAAPTPWDHYRLHFAVRKDWAPLAGLLDKALATMGPVERTDVHNRWISVRYEHGIRAADLVRWGLIVLIPLALLALLVFLHIRRLRREIAERVRAERERLLTIDKLQLAMLNIKKLSGLLPICASCKKIRDDQGYWQQVEEYVQQHSEAEFSHSLCPDCLREMYPEVASRVLEKTRDRPEDA